MGLITQPKVLGNGTGTGMVTATEGYNTNLQNMNTPVTSTPAPDPVAPPPPAPVVAPEPAPTFTATTPSARTITEPETVSGQLNALLASGSTYIQNARLRGTETANTRGLINSSMAAGAAERSAIEAGLPIAQADASVNASAGQSAQEAGQASMLSAQQAGQTSQISTQQAGQASQLSAQQAAEKRVQEEESARQNFGYTTATNAQNIAANINLQDSRIALDLTRITEARREQAAGAIAPLMQQLTTEEARIQAIPNAEMSPESKAQAITQLRQAAQARANTVTSLYGYNLSWPAPEATNTAAIPSNAAAPTAVAAAQATSAAEAANAAARTVQQGGTVTGTDPRSGPFRTFNEYQAAGGILPEGEWLQARHNQEAGLTVTGASQSA